jgi:hypothetical protein
MNQSTIFILTLSIGFAGCSSQVTTLEEPSSSYSQEIYISPSEVKISKQQFGNDWPFTVDEGLLACKIRGQVGNTIVGEVIFTVGEITYGINGIAKGTNKYAAIENIWSDNQSLPGTKKNISPIIQKGVELCK